MAKAITPSIESVYEDLKNRKFAPIYLFTGEEPYYIDQLSDYIENNVLTEDERAFNQSVLYGLDVSAEDVIATAKRFPMMSDYQVVIIKEAQQMKDTDQLVSYINNPQPSTILVFCFKGKEPDKRKKFYDSISKKGIYYVSERLKQEKMPEWVSNHFRKKGYRITAGAAVLLSEHVGNELEKVTNESDKLFLNAPVGSEINEKDIEKQVGISREFNVFEFQKALGQKNVFKANQIAMNIAGQKNTPLPMVMGSLYSYFSKLLHYQWLKGKGETNMASAMGVPPFFIRDYEQAARNFPPAKLLRIMNHLRNYDLKGKGFTNDAADDAELLKELTFKIVH